MGFSVEELLLRLTSPYDQDMVVPTSLPVGFGITAVAETAGGGGSGSSMFGESLFGETLFGDG